MSKRILTMVLCAALVLTVMMTAVAADTMYVKTGDGDVVNVRWTDSTANEVLGYIRYGAPVDVLATTKGGAWSLIHFKGTTRTGEYYDGDAYVMSKFLVSYKPEPFNKSSKSSSGSKSSGGSGSSGSGVGYNDLFAKAKIVTPYNITVYPTRSSGHVNVRWAPSKKATLLQAYQAGATLTVIAELGTDWFQVKDPQTGITGFVNKAYIH